MSESRRLDKFFDEFECRVEFGEEKRYKEISFKDENLSCELEYYDTGSGLGYCSYDIRYSENLRYLSKKSPHSFLCFNVGQSANSLSWSKDSLVLKPGQLCMGSINDSFMATSKHQGKSYKSQSIIIENSLIKELGIFKILGRDDEFCARITDANLTQNLILKELANSKIYSGKMREIFIESKILEMVYKSFAEAKTKDSDKFRYSEDDLKLIHKAREILLKDIQNPPTIKELATLCATNEFKLKNGFKHCFNTTIHRALQDERLKIAKSLLEQNDINIKEAAKIVGYRSFAHFTKIFKEKFGVLPMEILRGGKF
ncbi:helix-turn-helix domain-containing protein [Campylobacter sp. RM16187]|uniref:helix-turn-helix domain-containing protein n=1 Tax=Campylobacter sp. RM16187 TaxID=1660063 RepID=UPI0021B5C852|nr:AraC family transcriptional regulator [Campylobacter sp. RM16187]QKG28932.1 transcriptional regulator, AraC family [Campylobacter sp. RM16187]